MRYRALAKPETFADRSARNSDLSLYRLAPRDTTAKILAPLASKTITDRFWPLATDRIFMADGRFGWIVLQNTAAFFI
jgi:hypothetical protein